MNKLKIFTDYKNNTVDIEKISIDVKLSVGFNKINQDITIPFWFTDS